MAGGESGKGAPVLRKRRRAGEPAPNLPDYERASRGFSWARARDLLAGLPRGRGLNIAHEAVDRHLLEGHGERLAMRWHGRDGAERELTYRQLSVASNRFANALAGLRIAPGDRVSTLLGRTPELSAVALGTLKHRAVFCPLFPGFGPEPLKARLQLGGARVLVTTLRQYVRKVAPIRRELGALEHVVLLDGKLSGTLAWPELVGAASSTYAISPTSPADPALLHFTSGTTGTPRGALLAHESVVLHHLTGRWVLDLHDGDRYFCTADPGFAAGTSYGLLAPLTCGATLVVDEADFDAERCYGLLEREKVQVWYTAPSNIRRLMRAGEVLPLAHDLRHLRFLASTGEPLGADQVQWSARVFGRPFHDTWGQTETGGILVGNFAATEVRPGSMGRPLPGVVAGVLRRTARGVEEVAPGEVGELAFRPGWPSMFRASWNEPERYRRSFVNGWYLSGDLVRRDAEGCLWFVARAGDAIEAAGRWVGPFEVESALLEHYAVEEAAAIAVPEAAAGGQVKAFVSLRPGFRPDARLQRDILGFALKKLDPQVAPRELVFLAAIPKTRSGKILRRLLRARELAAVEGSGLELEPG